MFSLVISVCLLQADGWGGQPGCKNLTVQSKLSREECELAKRELAINSQDKTKTVLVTFCREK